MVFKLRRSKYWILLAVTGGLFVGWFVSPNPVQALTTQATVQLTRKSESSVVNPIVKPPTTATSTGSKDSLTIDVVSDLQFQTQATTQASTLLPTVSAVMVQVSDRRAQPSGWQLTVRPSGLSQGSKVLQSQLQWPIDGDLRTTNGNVSRPPRQVSPGKLINRQANPLLVAKTGQGLESWALVMPTKTAPVSLRLPAQNLTAGRYRGTLVWQLVSAPID